MNFFVYMYFGIDTFEKYISRGTAGPFSAGDVVLKHLRVKIL